MSEHPLGIGRAELPLGSRDVEDCFTLFLGRAPAAAVTAARVNTPVRGLLVEILQTPEFHEGVLTPLLLREALPQEGLNATPPLRLVDWCQRRLPLEAATRTLAGAARDWVTLLEVVLADATLIALVPALATAGIDRLCRERLAAQPIAKITRSVIGAIDSASTLEIRGWAVDLCDRESPVTLELHADNLFLGAVLCGEFRPDVKGVVGGEGRCGFTFRIPGARRELFAGGRTVIAVDSVSRERVGVSTPVNTDLSHGLDILAATRREIGELRRILERIESRLPELSRLASVPLEAYGEYWERFYRPAGDALAAQRRAVESLGYRPLISVVMPTWNGSSRLLRRAIDSVLRQTYERWELIVTDDASAPRDEVDGWLQSLDEARLRVLRGPERLGIAGNTNRGLAAATGEYVAFLDHDDELAPEALFEVVQALQERRFGLVYSDEDRIEEDALGRLIHHTPFFKPGFDPELLRSMNYVCHLVVLRRDLVTAVGNLRAGVEGAQDHDLLLRITERLASAQIRHIPKILYHWRVTPLSVSRAVETREALKDTIVRVVQEHLDRTGSVARAEAHSDAYGAARAFATRVRWALPAAAVAVIIPTRDRLELLQPCIDSVLRSRAVYPGAVDVLVVDNDSVEPATAAYLASVVASGAARTMTFRGEFNWSALNNAAARAARGEILVFLNNDTVVLSEDWLAELCANALRPEVGAVGARLLYEDGTIQHAGVVLGVEGVAGHDSVGEAPERGGYFGRSHLQRSAAAVTGACLATRREVFERVGGFDALEFKVAFNDVDYCLKVREAGYRVVYDPFAVLYHFESKSRGYDLSEAQVARQRAEAAVFRARWSGVVDADPYYNPHFERHARPFERLRAP